ncbi:MAG: hypothetical protein GXO56_07705 [Chloroflexi bacterium]|nr:hypothetical protein [Chloroflexota bacterium]
MTAYLTGAAGILGLLFVVLFGLLMVVLRVVKQPQPGRDLRPLRAFSRLRRAVNLTVESGQRLHISLGRGEITHPKAAVAFVGLSTLERFVEITAVSDRPAVASAGTGPLGILARSTLHAAYKAADQERRYRATNARVTGLTPFAYAVGTMFITEDDAVAANFLVGSFGPEVALIADGSSGHDALTVAGTDNIAAQAVLYASADEPLIGEEVYAAGAYVGSGGLHGTSVVVQDIFRWFLIAAMVGGALFKLLGGAL